MTQILDTNGMDIHTGLYPKSNGGTETMYRRLDEWLLTPNNLHDDFQVICSRKRILVPGKFHIFWAHDMAEDPETFFFRDQDEIDKFDFFAFVSVHQMQDYIERYPLIPIDRSLVIYNCYDSTDDVDVIFETAFDKYNERKPDDEINLIYHTTPHRGLGIAYAVFDRLKKDDPSLNIHLDVFSSFKAYGWDNRDIQFKETFDHIAAHPDITNHGFVERKILNQYLSRAHIFLYPCIWKETSSMSMIEAMLYGVVPVYPQYGALPETTGGLGLAYPPFKEVQHHAISALNQAKLGLAMIEKYPLEAYSSVRTAQELVMIKHNPARFVSQWKNVFDALKMHRKPRYEGDSL